MLSLKDRKLAALLLNGKHLTREQLDECLGIQRRLEVSRSLASIVVARRYVTSDRLKSIMSEALRAHATGVIIPKPQEAAPVPAPAPRLEPTPKPTPTSAPTIAEPLHWKADLQIARLIVARRVVTEEQVRECLAILQKLAPSRPGARLTQVILKRRYASREALRQILQEFEQIQKREALGGTATLAALQEQPAPNPSAAAPSLQASHDNLLHVPEGLGVSSVLPALRADGTVPQQGFFSSAPRPPETPAGAGQLSQDPAFAPTAPRALSQALAPQTPAEPSGDDPFASIKPNKRSRGNEPLRFGASSDDAGAVKSSGAQPRGGVAASNFGFSDSAAAPRGPTAAPASASNWARPANAAANVAASGFGSGSAVRPVEASRAPEGSGAYYGATAASNFGHQQAPYQSGPAPYQSGPVPAPYQSGPAPYQSGPAVLGGPAFQSGPIPLNTGPTQSNPVPMTPQPGAALAFQSGPMPSPAYDSGTDAPTLVGGVNPLAGGMGPGGSALVGPAGSAVAGSAVAGGSAFGAPAYGGPAASGLAPGGSGLAPGAMDRGGFKTLDLGAESATIAPVGPGGSAYGPGPGGSNFAAASGPAGSNFVAASGPAGSNYAGGSALAGGRDPDFKTLDLNARKPVAASASSPVRPVQDSKPAGSQSSGQRRDRSGRSGLNRSGGTGRSGLANRSGRSRSAVPSAPPKRNLISKEMGFLAVAATFILLVGGAIFIYMRNSSLKENLNNRLNSLVNQEKYEEALDVVGQLLAMEDRDEWRLTQKNLREEVDKIVKLRESDVLIKAAMDKSVEEGLADATKASELAPKNPRAFLALGEIRMKFGETLRRKGEVGRFRELLKKAGLDFRKAIALEQDNQKAIFLLAECLSRTGGQRTEIKSKYKRAYNCDQTTFIGFLASARAREIDEQEEQAIKDYSRALELRKNLVAALLGRGELYRRKRRYREATNDANRALEVDKERPEALFLRAHILIDNEDFAGAKVDIDRGLTLDRGSAFGLGLRAFLKYKDGKSDAALKDCDTALNLDKNNYFPYIVRGRIFLEERSNKVLARDDFNIAVRLAPRIAEAYYWCGRLAQENGDLTNALARYNKGIALDDGDYRLYANRGTVHRQLERFDDALRDHDKSVELAPDNGEARFQRAKARWKKLRRTNVIYNNSRWDGVLEDLNVAIKNQEDLGDAYGRRGYLAYKRGRYKEALSDYNKAIELDNGREKVYVWYGYRALLYTTLKRYDQGLTDAKRFLEQAPGTHENRSAVRKASKECQEALARGS